MGFSNINIQEPDRIQASHNRKKKRSQFEAGYVQQRAQWTRSRKQFTLKWSALPESDLDTLITDFNTNGDTSFDWTHPVRGNTYTVIYSGNAIEYDISTSDGGEFYAVTVDLEEL